MSITTLPPLRGEADATHDGLLAQLDAVQRFIAYHPSIPVTCADIHAGSYAVIRKFCGSTIEVDRIAAGIGIAARWLSATQYTARLQVGAACQYEVAYIAPREAQDQDPAGRELAEVAA